MSEHYNGLAPDEHERLSLLLEELGEVQQVIGKIMRHGYESYHPSDQTQTTNRELLEQELGDVSASMNMMVRGGDLDFSAIHEHTREKLRRVNKYLHHQNVEVAQ